MSSDLESNVHQNNLNWVKHSDSIIYAFEDYHLDAGHLMLYRDGEEVPLTPKQVETLLALIEQRGEIVSKDVLMNRLWGDAAVEESNLIQNIYILRKVLGETRDGQPMIETLRRRGYRFNPELTDHKHRPSAVSAVIQLASVDGVLEPSSAVELTENRDAATVKALKFRLIAMISTVLLAVIVAGYFYYYSAFPTTPDKEISVLASKQNDEATTATSPEYKQLTFDRGTVWSARFVPGSNAIYYNASINGGVVDIYSLQPPSTESLSLNVPNTSLLSVSSKGEKAILLNQEYLYQFIHRGVLARIPLGGTIYKMIAEDVQEADWSPDGEQLAIIRWSPNSNRLEYPIGNVLAETNGYFSSPRVSPDGSSIAFLDHDIRWDNRGYVSIIGTDGRLKLRSEEWNGLEGLAWKGDEVWFSASKSGDAFSVYALSMDGGVRSVERGPVNLILNDIGTNDLVLLSRAFQQTDVFLSNSNNANSELSWMHLIGIGDIAPDGSAFLFTHFGEGSGKNYSIYLRKTDGSAAVRLGEGRGLALSPDGRFAIAKLSKPESLLVLPTGTGEQLSLASGNVVRYSKAGWFPDNERIIFSGNEHGKPTRSFEQSLNGGHPMPITPEGIHGTLVSPDSKRLVVSDRDGRKLLLSFSSGELKEIKGLETNEEIIQWNADGTHIYVNDPMELPIKIFQLNPETGRRKLTREILPINRNGLIGKMYVFITPNGKTVLYGLRRYLMDLYSVGGLK